MKPNDLPQMNAKLRLDKCAEVCDKLLPEILSKFASEELSCEQSVVVLGMIMVSICFHNDITYDTMKGVLKDLFNMKTRYEEMEEDKS